MIFPNLFPPVCIYKDKRLKMGILIRMRGGYNLLQNQTDETLVMLTLAGEQDAYEVLVRRYQRAVVSAAA